MLQFRLLDTLLELMHLLKKCISDLRNGHAHFLVLGRREVDILALMSVVTHGGLEGIAEGNVVGEEHVGTGSRLLVLRNAECTGIEAEHRTFLL